MAIADQIEGYRTAASTDLAKAQQLEQQAADLMAQAEARRHRAEVLAAVASQLRELADSGLA